MSGNLCCSGCRCTQLTTNISSKHLLVYSPLSPLSPSWVLISIANLLVKVKRFHQAQYGSFTVVFELASHNPIALDNDLTSKLSFGVV